jgi:flagellar basal-body rod protein FlgF
MENLSYISLSQQMALQQQMEITANNIANINTPGFKSQNEIFLEYLNRSASGDTLKQVKNAGSYRDLTSGALKMTSNELDFAIQGEGYFTVETPQGTRYTRDGSFSLNDKNEIVTQSGYKVMGDGGALTVQPGASRITVSSDGSVSTEKGTVGKMKVVNFDNDQKLSPEGGNLYNANGQQETPVEKVQIVQGSIESSNVNPVVEMNKMIEGLRLYQASQKMIQNDHERIRTMIQKLTKS